MRISPKLFLLMTLLTAINASSSNSKVIDVHLDSNFDNNCFKEDPKCRIRLVESLPEGLHYNGSGVKHISTFHAWNTLLDLVVSELDLASSYWSLNGDDFYPHPSDWQGKVILHRLEQLHNRNVDLRIAQNQPTKSQPSLDTERLAELPRVQVRSLNFTRLVGSGILHTKLWVADKKHFYVGSANFDWRSLTQVKELGLLATHCSCLARDMRKIFDVYWALGKENAVIPDRWPEALATRFNHASPMILPSENLVGYIASSPSSFCPSGRDADLMAILNVINGAKKFVHVAVMDYFPATIYTQHTRFWPVIDDALRTAAIERGVQVRLLLSQWKHTRDDMRHYLQSLLALNGTNKGRTLIEGKMFKVPSYSPDQAAIPYARVNHNKYMVSDRSAYVGTSNWSADYFLFTGGVSVVFENNNDDVGNDLRNELNAIFLRDWNSEFALNA